jgi:hypothetical protein
MNVEPDQRIRHQQATFEKLNDDLLEHIFTFVGFDERYVNPVLHYGQNLRFLTLRAAQQGQSCWLRKPRKVAVGFLF